MKKINKYILALVVIAFAGQSCKKDFIDINTNPNKVDEANPEFLFAGTTLDINLNSRDRTAKKYGTTMTYMQYVTPNANTREGLSGAYWDATKTTGPNPGFIYYNDYYTGIGRDMTRLIGLINNLPAERQKTYQGLKAMSMVVNIYHAWRVADIYGALPYGQAFDALRFPMPVYDYDYTLYKIFDEQLKEAALLIKNNADGQINMANQDLFLDGDYKKWYALANTLRIKIAQRYEKRDAAHLNTVLTDIQTNFGSQIISSVDGAFAYKHSQTWNNNVDDINALLLNYNASYAFVEFLKSTKDPRIKFMVRENDLGENYTGYKNVQTNGSPAAKAALLNPEYQTRYIGKHAFPASADGAFGITSGLRDVSFALTGTSTQNLGVLSNIQTRLFVKNGGFGGFDARSARGFMHDDETLVDGSAIKMKTLYLSYAETCFMMAEIAEKGGNGLGKSASQWFYDGIQASFDQYKAVATAANVPNAAAVAIGSLKSDIPYLGLPSIYSQAWVNFLLQPDEAWAMWKRTGYPQFEDVRAGQPNKIGNGSSIAYLESLWDGSKNLIIPRRSTLQLSVGSNPNSENFNKAVNDMKAKDAAFGVDVNDTKGRIWWDKQ